MAVVGYYIDCPHCGRRIRDSSRDDTVQRYAGHLRSRHMYSERDARAAAQEEYVWVEEE